MNACTGASARDTWHCAPSDRELAAQQQSLPAHCLAAWHPPQELILFSRADLERSIPCMVDGLKPGQRKIMFGCFKRNLKSDVKVVQLAGYVSEHSGGWRWCNLMSIGACLEHNCVRAAGKLISTRQCVARIRHCNTRQE